MARTDILRGPAVIQFDNATFYSKGDITVQLQQTTFPIEVSQFGGKIDDRVDQISHVISFTPAGEWEALSVLFPYATKLPGSSVFGADKPLTIWTLDGKKRVYKAAAVTQMPNIILGSTQTLFGEMQFTCLHAENSDWDDANSLFTDSSQSYPGDASFSAADIITQPYTLRYGESAPWDEFRTKEGVQISFNLSLAPETNDWKGLFDFTFQSLEVSATLIPDGVSPANVLDLLKHQGTGAVRGRSLGGDAPNLDIIGDGVFVRLNSAAAVLGNEAYGVTQRRVGQMEFRATRTIVEGALQPLFIVGTEDPEEDGGGGGGEGE